ncbi:hypothetical protein [uncultured Tessaracoccus sp.]|uniref:hypothetical protein n=1 Tax=uncultured Tessaracoccus sp. TaxID=905023 RepID=UPI00262AB2A9|nr:hypothetical protein [uncultured Tessaracoccus sp.]
MSTSLLVTIILMILAVAFGVGFWAHSRRARPLVGAVGTALIPLGLYFLGVMDLAVNGVMSIVHWVQRIEWGTTMSVGAGLAGGGLLLAIVALFLPKEPKAKVPTQPQSQGGRRPVAGDQLSAGNTKRPTTAGTGKPTAPAGMTSKDGLTDEDREIEQLLKQRGIM